jgi:hypothetical protein
MTVVATTGAAVSSGLCGSGGIRWMTISLCGRRNYSSHNNLRSIAEKNFETGPFDRSGTSPRKRRRGFYHFAAASVYLFCTAPGLRRGVARLPARREPCRPRI